MQIALFIQVLVALLGLAAKFQQVNCEEEHFDQSLYHTVFDRRSGDRPKHRHERSELNATRYYQHNKPLKFGNKTKKGERLSIKQSWDLINTEYMEMNKRGVEMSSGVECCPSVLEMVEPSGGKNIQGIFVDLYRSDTYKQMFYELSCHKLVLNKPCRFVQKQMHPHSKCVQMYSYTYALVKADTSVSRDKKSPAFPGSLDAGNNSYILDYIEVRSGCTCVIDPPAAKREEKNKENKNLENKKSKKNNKLHKNIKPHHHSNRHRNKNDEFPLLPRDDDLIV